MIKLPEKCLRDYNDCEPLAQLKADGFDDFICIGLNNGKTRKIKNDIFRKCDKGLEIDTEFDCDYRDLTDEISVIGQALSIKENMKANKE